MDNLGRLLLQSFERFPEKRSLIDAGGQAITYGALAKAAIDVERALRDAGLESGEPVLVPVANEARDAAALIGVWMADGVAVPVARQAPKAALETIQATTGARFSLINEANRQLQRLGEATPPPRPILKRAAIVILTSGSTGRPKGVVLGHDAFIGKLHAIDSMLAFTPDTRTLVVLQITFVFGLWLMLLTLLKAGTVWIQPRFDPVKVLVTLRDERISDVALVPTMMRKFLALDETASIGKVAPLQALRILTGGEPFGRDLSERMSSFMPHADIIDIYGSTETCSSDFFLLANDRTQFAGTIGQPGPRVQFCIVDGQGRRLPANGIGELQILTPFIMSGYLDEPKLTQAAFANEFFRTGDLARLREDGRVELAGRIKDLIVRGGTKISPLELDYVLLEHPAVAAALTTGIPDEIMGERIHALIVPRANANIDARGLRDWLAGRIERFKWPDAYHFARELPTGRTGKVDRNALREQVLQGTLSESDHT